MLTLGGGEEEAKGNGQMFNKTKQNCFSSQM